MFRMSSNPARGQSEVMLMYYPSPTRKEYLRVSNVLLLSAYLQNTLALSLLLILVSLLEFYYDSHLYRGN